MKRKALCLIIAWALLSPGAALAERLAVGAPVGNVRSGPGTRYGVVWQVEQYHPVQVIEKKGNWYRFRDFENDSGWIHKSLLKDIPSVITTGATNNVRSGPGMNHDIVFSVEKGVPFKVLSKEGHWIRIEHADGDGGWIHASLVW
jgi:SH3-like domain-containing protein